MTVPSVAGWRRERPRNTALLAAGAVAALELTTLAALPSRLVPYGFMAIALALGFVAVTLRAPLVPFLVALASLAITFEFLPNLVPHASTAYRGHRLLIILMAVPLIASRGFDRRRLPLVAITSVVLLIVGAAFATAPVELARATQISATIEVVAIWIIAQLAWRHSDVVPTATVIAALAPISVALGYVLQVLGWTTELRAEFTGVNRLQGASIPAFLALMATVGVGAAVLLIRIGLDRRGWVLLIADAAIASLTVTRGALIAIVIIALPVIARTLWNRSGAASPAASLVRLIVAVAVIGIAISAIAPRIGARADQGTDAASFTSGRAVAWSYFLDEASHNPVFGRGIGVISVLGVKNVDLKGNFTGAHNEYLRIYVESGIVGAVLMLTAMIVTIGQRYRDTAGWLRIDMAALILATAIYAGTDNNLNFQYGIPFVCLLGLYPAARRLTDSGIGRTRA